ncbi:hypothetical protein [Brevibacillus sp. SKDU10]|uniref:hypothetical protein n=1 Tax=Brevibacillus sp. SKDU10 TaxID=1247872 RepID=UPI000A7DBD0B|nr:hypothetical protein [Brevibacillus sp. SKDU10]
MSIGYPVTSKFFMPMTSRGKPDDHENRYCTKPAFKKKWECEDSSKASDWDPGIGVAAEYDLKMGNNNYTPVTFPNMFTLIKVKEERLILNSNMGTRLYVVPYPFLISPWGYPLNLTTLLK